MNQTNPDFLLKLKSRSLLWLGASLGFALVVGTIVHGLPFAFWKAGAASFNISGVTGGTDATTDIYLSNGTDPTIHFETLAGATSYDVVIKDAAGVVTQCSSLSQASSPVSPSGCGLTNNTTYKIYVTGNPGTIGAANNGFSFTVDNTPPTTNTITGITGASDAVVDIWLIGGVLATVNWNAFTNAGSYDVTIKDTTGTTTVCATENTTGTSYDFSGCTLTDGTAYRAYVTARSAAGFQTTDASNTAFSFTVDNTAPGSFSITGIIGGTDVVADNILSNGTDPTVVYGNASNVYRYDLTIKDSTGTTTICTLNNETTSPSAMTCGLTDETTYKAYVTAKSISGYMTTDASNNGYTFTVSSTPVSSPGNFQITGATGGSDTTTDNWLTSGTTVTANWTPAAGAQNYSVTIRNASDSTDVCATQVTTNTSYTFTGCTLTDGAIYLIKVLANNSPATPTAAFNNGYAFQLITSAPGPFSISGVQGDVDGAADNYLIGGTIATVYWSPSTGATSYDVTIRNAANTADVCSTQNDTSSPYTFTGCNLSLNTSYTIQVVAKNATQSTVAYNAPFTFLVPNAVNFCPTGSSTAKALIIYDSGGPSGNYVGNEDCNFTISPSPAPTSITLDFVTFGSNDNSDIFTAYDGTSTAGTLLGTYKNTSIAPANLIASTNMYLTWNSGAANHTTGYYLSYIATYAAAGSFSITGVKGGTDATADAVLTDNSSGVTVDWGASTNAASYDVVIRNASNTNDICAKVNTTSTTYAFTGCTLMLGASYIVTVYANNSAGVPVAATNNPFSFTYEYRPASFSITGVTGGTDVIADTYLDDGTTATINWADTTNETSYDVTIYENDGATVACAKVNVAANSTSYAFTGCILVTGQYYKAEVIAKNAAGSTLAINSSLTFRVGAPWTPTSLASTPVGGNTYTAVWTGAEMIVYGRSSYDQAGGKYNPTTDSWTSISQVNSPAARYNHTAIWTGTEMIVWGGGNYLNIPMNTGGRYNPASNTWVTSSFTLVAGRKLHTAVWTGSEMIVWGGLGPTSSNYLNGGLKYNPTTDSWSAISDVNAPVARAEHTAIWTDTEMIVWGGWDGNYVGSGGKYNPATNSWTAVTITNAPTARRYHTAVWTGTEMIVWGGAGGSYVNTGGKYNPSTDSWIATSVGTHVPIGRYSHTAVWTGTEMIVWGGTDSSLKMDTGGRYNPSTDTWSASVLDLLIPRDEHKAIWTGSEMIVWGGMPNGSTYLNSGAKYNPSTDSWTATSTGANVPSRRRLHTVVWTGTEMIVWGGAVPSGVNTGGKYNPSSDSWTATSTGANVPTPRFDHTAIWTGTEMIVWGGVSANTGGRYDPSTDSWTATSTGANVPSGRSYHTAVWTGTEMIVWGGAVGSYFDTGGKYNPSTDSWTTTSTGANVPAARSGHTAIWTGSEMIVWGGTNGSVLNTGGKYAPATDAWTATSTGANVPTARIDHTVIWTGTEMIIWGGWTTTYANSGGKYNPATDSWTATSTGANVPTTRRDHAAIWTGTEMIVWGGNGMSSLYFKTGGKYNPSTDTWISTNSNAAPNTPSGRYGHTAVWTGTEMIIWGGFSSTVLNTGAKYNPTSDSWTATSLGISGRNLHTAIWTGSEMIIWGGVVSGSSSNTGGVYTSSTDSWTATTTTNVPGGRKSHTAVWTGSEMIVWGGGVSTNDVLDSGGRYNVSLNSWVSSNNSPAPNTPGPRINHTAIWTGSEMVVWGGGDASSVYYNTGGKYNPSTDSWSATSTGVNVPDTRRYHTAIWTGTEMIVWGGSNGGYHNTGGKYNPSTDSWSTTTTVSAPVGRIKPTAVWTGTNMIIWGGTNPSVINTGAIYDPISDTWTATTTTNAPVARDRHAAVWTGSEMIIWGGYGSTYLNTGGTFNPVTNSWSATSLTNVPTARREHVFVWTGSNMIIWSGYGGSFVTSGGVYTP